MKKAIKATTAVLVSAWAVTATGFGCFANAKYTAAAEQLEVCKEQIETYKEQVAAQDTPSLELLAYEYVWDVYHGADVEEAYSELLAENPGVDKSALSDLIWELMQEHSDYLVGD